MTTAELLTGALGFIFVAAFFGLMLLFAFLAKKQPRRGLREIPVFTRLRKMVGMSVEAGKRLHIAVGSGGLTGTEGGAALAGLNILERITRAASISDHPPIASSGNGALSILTRDTLQGAFRAANADNQYDPAAGRVLGLTPFSYAAGAIPLMHDEGIATNVLIGHFGSEVALLTEAGEQTAGLTIAGTDHIPAQAVLYASAQEPLIGEELYVGGAYLGAGPIHTAALRAQDVLRWVLVGVMLAGALAKLVGVL